MSKLFASAVLAGFVALSASSHSGIVDLFPGGDFPADLIGSVTGGNPSLDEQNLLVALQTIAAGQGLPAPTPFASPYNGGPILAGDYLVLFYGPGSTSTSGGLDMFYFDEDLASFSVPPVGAGPAGTGDLVFARLYDHVRVPDGGTTWTLLGISLACLGFLKSGWRCRS